MKNADEYYTFVKNRGYALLGVADLVLTLNDALTAVALAREAEIVILGGDVYVRRSGEIMPAYANWHTDRRQGESKAAYARRTWKETEAYLRGYPKSQNEEPLFALVTDDKP